MDVDLRHDGLNLDLPHTRTRTTESGSTLNPHARVSIIVTVITYRQWSFALLQTQSVLQTASSIAFRHWHSLRHMVLQTSSAGRQNWMSNQWSSREMRTALWACILDAFRLCLSD